MPRALSPQSSLQCAVGAELDVLNALKRRGAGELAKLLSYEQHEKLVNLLFNELQKEPLDGFKKVSLAQVAAAGGGVFARLAGLTRGGLPLGPAGQLPLDVHLDAVVALPSVMWILMPKPKQSAPEKKCPKQQPPKEQYKQEEESRQEEARQKGFFKFKKRARFPCPIS